MLRGRLSLLLPFPCALYQERIRAQPNVKHGEGERYPAFEMRQRDVLVFDWLVLLFPIVTADEPLMAEQRDRKLIFKLVDHRELRCVQVLVGIHQRPPDETHDQSVAGISAFHRWLPNVEWKTTNSVTRLEFSVRR